MDDPEVCWRVCVPPQKQEPWPKCMASLAFWPKRGIDLFARTELLKLPKFLNSIAKAPFSHPEKHLVQLNNRAWQSPWLNFYLSHVTPEEIPPLCSSITPLCHKSSARSLHGARTLPTFSCKVFSKSFPNHVSIIMTLGINSSEQDGLYSAPFKIHAEVSYPKISCSLRA